MFASILLSYVLPIVGTALSSLAVYGVGRAIIFLRSRTKNAAINNALGQLSELASHAVMATEQTFVDALKKQGAWGTASSYTQAANAALETLKGIAADKLAFLAANGFGDVDKIARTLIESQLKSIELQTK